MSFTLKIEPEAKIEIQEGIKWYNRQSPGLGNRFHRAVQANFNKLQLNPYHRIRYKKVRCLPLNKFPFMIHYSVDENQELIIVHAVFNTARNPDIWDKRI